MILLSESEFQSILLSTNLVERIGQQIQKHALSIVCSNQREVLFGDAHTKFTEIIDESPHIGQQLSVWRSKMCNIYANSVNGAMIFEQLADLLSDEQMKSEVEKDSQNHSSLERVLFEQLLTLTTVGGSNSKTLMEKAFHFDGKCRRNFYDEILVALNAAVGKMLQFALLKISAQFDFLAHQQNKQSSNKSLLKDGRFFSLINF